jgi:hypothetical protein
VGTVDVVQAIVGDQEVGQDLAPEDSLGDNARHILDLDAAIPDALRVNHDRWAVLALLEATGMIRTRQRTESGLLECDLEGLPQLLMSVRVTAPSLVAGRTNVTANENMMREGWHIRPFWGRLGFLGLAIRYRRPTFHGIISPIFWQYEPDELPTGRPSGR